MKLKLDLHTHPLEATRFVEPTIEVVAEIMARIKGRGLDGIAITEHNNKEYGYRVKAIAERHFPGVIVIPGQEIEVGLEATEQAVELYLPDGSTFRFWVHPAYPPFYPWGFDCIGGIHGIEVANAMYGHLSSYMLEEVARRNGLFMLRNSDAHYLDDIGRHFNQVDLEELCCLARCRR